MINLRNSVVPVVDLRMKFGMTRTESSVNTCVIIIEVTVDGETTILGALADSVREVIDLDPDHIAPAPRIGSRLDTDFIRGMGKHGERFIMILDIDKVFSADELAFVWETAPTAQAAWEANPAGATADAAAWRNYSVRSSGREL